MENQNLLSFFEVKLLSYEKQIKHTTFYINTCSEEILKFQVRKKCLFYLVHPNDIDIKHATTKN